MIDIAKLSRRFCVREMTDADTDEILALYLGNPQFFRYSEACPTRLQVASDLKVTPLGVTSSHKHYVGFYQGQKLVAVMDLVDGYPAPEIAYIGLFMVGIDYQGRNLGTELISEVKDCLRRMNKTSIRLAIDRENPQSTHFWKKNGFTVIRELDRHGWSILEAEHELGSTT